MKNSWIGHQQKRQAKLLDWAPAETYWLGTSRNYSWGDNHKIHIMGKLQGLRPCNFQWNSWKLGTSISFLLWENCRGFAPAIFRGTLGNWGIHNFRYWNSWISRERKGTDQNAQLGTIRSVQLGTSRIFHHDQIEGQPLLPWLRGPRDNSRSCGGVIACQKHRKYICTSGIDLLLR